MPSRVITGKKPGPEAQLGLKPMLPGRYSIPTTALTARSNTCHQQVLSMMTSLHRYTYNITDGISVCHKKKKTGSNVCQKETGWGRLNVGNGLVQSWGSLSSMLVCLVQVLATPLLLMGLQGSRCCPKYLSCCHPCWRNRRSYFLLPILADLSQ